MSVLNKMIIDAAGAVDAAAETLKIAMDEITDDKNPMPTHNDVMILMATAQNATLMAIARTLMILAASKAEPVKAAD